LTVSRERKRARKREKTQSFETCFPALLVGITQAPSYNNTNSLQQQQHQHPPAATTPTLVTLEVTTITQKLIGKRNLLLST
jgi:hypothetical protein